MRQSRMLLGRDRLFYAGLVGNEMKTRRLGAITIYAAPEQGLEIAIAGGPWRRCGLVALAPYVSHRLRTDSGRIATLCLESESIDRAAMQTLLAMGEDEKLIGRIVEARPDGDGFSTQEFDQILLGRVLAPRALDPRIRAILDAMIDAAPDGALSAQVCARRIGVSVSRFLHLFKQETDIAFRLARMWKRARRFMDHAHRDDSLTEVALDLGYPDSSHFSRSIRACYGLQPRSNRQGSRGMAVSLGENYALS